MDQLKSGTAFAMCAVLAPAPVGEIGKPCRVTAPDKESVVNVHHWMKEQCVLVHVSLINMTRLSSWFALVSNIHVYHLIHTSLYTH